MEIERKFLAGDPPGLDSAPAERIEQGYLAADPDGGGEVRLRRKGDRLLLTAKRGSGLAREEVELELESDQFEALWPLTQERRVEKVRHRLEHEGRSLEVDVYGGELEGLVVAEIEFESEAAAARFEAPGWLGREVTGDERYSNRALAERGTPA